MFYHSEGFSTCCADNQHKSQMIVNVELSYAIILPFIVVITATNIVFLLKLHEISLNIKRTQDKQQPHSILYGGTKLSDYSPLQNDDDDDCIDEQKEQLELNQLTADINNEENKQLELSQLSAGINNQHIESLQIMMQSQSDIKYFGEDSWFRKLIRHRTPKELIHLLLQVWCLSSGAISLYLSAVFYMNLLVEYILICMSVGWIGILAGITAILLVVCVSWIFRRKFESIIIITRNTLDLRSDHISYSILWRFCNFSLCVIFSIITALYNEIIPFSDVLFFQMFLTFMFIFALSFQLLYVLCTIVASIRALIYNKSKEKFCKLLCGIEQHEKNYVQYIVLFILFIFVTICIVLWIVNNGKFHLFKFSVIVVVLYWCITVIEPGKCNALFLLWSHRFQDEYFIRPQILANTETIETGKNNNDFFVMKYMEIWENIYFDYKWNGHFGVNKYCHFFRDFLGWLCTLCVMIIFLVVTYIYAPTINESVEHRIVDKYNIMSLPTYPICDMVLRNNQYLTAMDLVYLTKTAYFANSTHEILNQFSIWFGHQYNESWNVSTLSVYNDNVTFYHIKNHQYNFDLIAVRGTDDSLDIMEDISLWSEVSTFQIFSLLIPLTDLFPLNFIQYFVKISSFSEHIISPNIREKYDEPVYEYIKRNIMTKGDDYVIVAGHSLGGGIAQIVAAKLFEYDRNGLDNIISFGLSSPGTLYSSTKFGFSTDSLDKTSVSVLPRRDIVSMVDEHGGIVQEIECDAKMVDGCHYAQTSFCEMYEQCGNETIRNVTFTQCVCIGKGRSDWTACW
eukprot:111230_1